MKVLLIGCAFFLGFANLAQSVLLDRRGEELKAQHCNVLALLWLLIGLVLGLKQ